MRSTECPPSAVVLRRTGGVRSETAAAFAADWRSAPVLGRSHVDRPAGSECSEADARFALLRPGRALSGGFTMIEIALCLAIVGFALVSILLVLPSGMNTQSQTRQETIIGQDATELIEAIRNGAFGMDDLTNYVYAISNDWTAYSARRDCA